MATLKQIRDIQIFAEIHQGGPTLVFKGYQADLDRFVLLKVLRPELSDDETLTARFQEEARLIAKVKHPNVVTLFDYGRDGNCVFLATEFVDGVTLKELLEAGPLPVDIATFVLTEAARGLQAAHKKDILHQDIKPSNLLISHEGEVKLADFGMADLASEAGPESGGGTLAYFAPERILGENVTPAADIFALGATFYEMLAGVQAFHGDNVSEFFDAILNEDPIRYLRKHPGIPDGLVTVCARMLAKKPEERYPDCAALLEDLQRFATEHRLETTAEDLQAYLRNPADYPVWQPERAATSPTPEPKRAPVWRRTTALASVTILAILLLFAFRTLRERDLPASGIPGLTASDSTRVSERTRPFLAAAETTVLSTEAPPTRSDVRKASSTTPERPPATRRSPATNGDRTRPEPTRARSAEPEGPKPGATAASQASGPSEKPAQTGTLRLVCNPWAHVFVDGDSIGTTPFDQPLELDVGRHRLRLMNPEFPPYTTWVRIGPDSATTLEFSFWDQVGTLMVLVSPYAQIFVDGTYRDTTPLTKPLILTPGEHTLTLKHPNFADWSTTVVVAAGETKQLSFNLWKLHRK